MAWEKLIYLTKNYCQIILYSVIYFYNTVFILSCWTGYYLKFCKASVFYNVYCCCSVDKSQSTLCNPQTYSKPGAPVFHYLQEFALVRVHKLVMLSNHLILCCPLLLLLQSFPASGVLHFMDRGKVILGSQVAWWVKSLPAVQETQETQMWSLGLKDPLKHMAL